MYHGVVHFSHKGGGVDDKKIKTQIEDKIKMADMMLEKAKDMGKDLSKFIGVDVEIEVPHVDGTNSYIKCIPVKVPSSTTDGYIELLEDLDIDKDNLKEIVLKMKRVEGIFIAKLQQEYLFRDIEIPLVASSFMKIDEETIVDMMVDKYKAEQLVNIPVGGTFEYDDKKYEVIEVDDKKDYIESCDDCAFLDLECLELKEKGVIPLCGELSRLDGKNVIFKEVEEE